MERIRSLKGNERSIKIAPTTLHSISDAIRGVWGILKQLSHFIDLWSLTQISSTLFFLVFLSIQACYNKGAGLFTFDQPKLTFHILFVWTKRMKQLYVSKILNRDIHARFFSWPHIYLNQWGLLWMAFLLSTAALLSKEHCQHHNWGCFVLWFKISSYWQS